MAAFPGNTVPVTMQFNAAPTVVPWSFFFNTTQPNITVSSLFAQPNPCWLCTFTIPLHKTKVNLTLTVGAQVPTMRVVPVSALYNSGTGTNFIYVYGISFAVWSFCF